MKNFFACFNKSDLHPPHGQRTTRQQGWTFSVVFFWCQAALFSFLECVHEMFLSDISNLLMAVVRAVSKIANGAGEHYNLDVFSYSMIRPCTLSRGKKHTSQHAGSLCAPDAAVQMSLTFADGLVILFYKHSSGRWIPICIHSYRPE